MPPGASQRLWHRRNGSSEICRQQAAHANFGGSLCGKRRQKRLERSSARLSAHWSRIKNLIIKIPFLHVSKNSIRFRFRDRQLIRQLGGTHGSTRMPPRMPLQIQPVANSSNREFGIVKRFVFLFGAIGVGIAAPAFADDLTVSANTAAALATLTAANGTPGNITITNTGSVAISAAGAAVTLNSNNIVSNSGTISNSVGISAIGVQINGVDTGSFTNKGIINVPGTGSPPTSTAQFGVLLNGSGAFTGDIVTTTGSSITISGLSANALAVQSELNGNLTQGGSIAATGSGSNGVIISALIDGAFVNKGTITTARGPGALTSVSPGSAIEIGGSVNGGFLNVGPVNNADTTAAAVVSEVGVSPALIVAPSIGLDIADVALGTVSDVSAPGYSFINRGKITATGDVPGIAATTIQIGNAADNTSGRATVFSGGFYNSGTISAVATSDAPNALSAAAGATTFVIGNGATIPLLTNDASGTISATTGGALGGNAFGLVIQTGGSLAALNNVGIIASSANATNTAAATLTAYAIQDATGTLTHITNSGTISATATPLVAGTQKTVAADLSAATSATIFTNTGTVTGDILFGGAANQLTIEGPHASVAGQVQAFHGGSVNITVSSGGTGGTLQTSHVTGAGTLIVGPGGIVNLELGANAPVVSATGAISFNAASHIVLTPTTILPSANALTLIHSDTSLSFGNFAATTANIQVPFLFTGSLSSDAKDLILNLQRKTASQLGFTGNAAAIYEPALNAALNDSVFGGALSSLGNAADVQTAVEQLLPITSAAALAAIETITDSNLDAVGARQRTLLLAPNPAAGFGIWGQGLYGLFHGSDQDSYSGHGAGGVVGFDFIQPGSGHFGLALTVYTAQLDDKSPLNAKTEAQTYLISPYMGFRIQNFFIDAQLNAGESNLQTTRSVNVGSLSRVAEGRPDEMLASGGITSGYVLNLGFIQLVPQASLNGIELFDHAYTESGGGAGVDLTVNSHSQSSLRGFLGLAAGGAYDTGGSRLVPQVLAGWSQELVTGSTTIDAAFASVSQSTFEVSGPVANRSHLTAGAGLDFVDSNWSVGLKYSAAIRSSALSQTAGLTMSARF
jgi:uncharacterized protein with beta-barrel porin domain